LSNVGTLRRAGDCPVTDLIWTAYPIMAWPLFSQTAYCRNYHSCQQKVGKVISL